MFLLLERGELHFHESVLDECGIKRAEESIRHPGEAERLLAGGLAAAGLTSSGLETLPGSDARKVAIAGLLRRRCMVSNGWLAERLKMRSAANVSQQLRRAKDANQARNLPAPLRRFLSVSACQ